jgi:hypothetical protein
MTTVEGRFEYKGLSILSFFPSQHLTWFRKLIGLLAPMAILKYLTLYFPYFDLGACLNHIEILVYKENCKNNV